MSSSLLLFPLMIEMSFHMTAKMLLGLISGTPQWCLKGGKFDMMYHLSNFSSFLLSGDFDEVVFEAWFFDVHVDNFVACFVYAV